MTVLPNSSPSMGLPGAGGGGEAHRPFQRTRDEQAGHGKDTGRTPQQIRSQSDWGKLPVRAAGLYCVGHLPRKAVPSDREGGCREGWRQYGAYSSNPSRKWSWCWCLRVLMATSTRETVTSSFR